MVIVMLIIYPCLVSSVLTNANKPQPFNLQRGVRRGDPLSPFPFWYLSIDPLVAGVSSHPGIQEITFGNVRSLINLCADDLLICLSDPVISVPNLQNYIKSCSSLSRYTINGPESEFMPLNNNLSLALLNWLLLTLATLDLRFTETLHFDRNCLDMEKFKVNIQNM